MIKDFGQDALAKATERSQELRAEGFDSIANTWDLICEVIRDQQASIKRPEDYKSALSKNVILSE